MEGASARRIYGAEGRGPRLVWQVAWFVGFVAILWLGQCELGELSCTARRQTCVVGHAILPWSEQVSFDRESTVEVVRRKRWRVVLHGVEGERTVLLSTTEEHAHVVAAAVRRVIAGERQHYSAAGRTSPMTAGYFALLIFVGVALLLWAHRSPEPGAGEGPRSGR